MKRKYWRLCCAAILVLAVALSGCANPEKDWQEQYDLGMRYLSEGDYEEAILAFSAAIEIDDSRPEAYMGRAEAYEAIGDHEKALRDYKRARKIAKANDDEDLVEDLEEIIEDLEEIIENGEDDRPVSDDEIPGEEGPQGFAITVTDAYSDYITGYNYGDYAYCYHIPQINLRDDLAAEVNREIYDTLYPILEENVYSHMETYGYPFCGGMRYCWGIQKDILSVLVITEVADWYWTDYYVFNVSLKTGKLLSQEEVLAAFGLDTDAFRELAAEILRQDIEGSYTEESIEGMGRDCYNSLITDTVSAENLSQILTYVGGNGNLCMVAGVYVPAGAGYYLRTFDMRQRTRIEYAPCTAEHSAVDDAPAAYSAEEITRMVVDWYNTHPVGDGEHGYMAYETETYVENGKCIITVRYDESGSNIRVDTAEVDMITGEFWADGYYLDDLW